MNVSGTVIGLAQRNVHYKPVRPGSSWVNHRPKHETTFGIPEGYDGGEVSTDTSIDKVMAT